MPKQVPSTSLSSGLSWDNLSRGVQTTQLSNGDIAVRDGKDPNGPVLVFTPSEWAAFCAGVRIGDFDDLLK